MYCSTAEQIVAHQADYFCVSKRQNLGFRRSCYTFYLPSAGCIRTLAEKMITYTDIREGNFDVIKDFGASNDLDIQLDHGTPLTLAAFEGRVKIVKLMLASGADPDYRASNGWTPLIAASNDGRSRIVEILLEAGANPTLSDSSGRSPLHHVCYCPRKSAVDTAQILLSHGGNHLQKDNKGVTPFSLAESLNKRDELYQDGLLTALVDDPDI